ncbi:MAG: hypothetical protein KTM48_03580 [Wolbachia endosymbiont of Pissodes strobi]|nr:hypothetical protein [Wolbachia endosymbiont of Pissodes strobi]
MEILELYGQLGLSLSLSLSLSLHYKVGSIFTSPLSHSIYLPTFLT